MTSAVSNWKIVGKSQSSLFCIALMCTLAACVAPTDGSSEEASDELDASGVAHTAQALAAFRGAKGTWIAPEGSLITTVYWCIEPEVGPEISSEELLTGVMSVDAAISSTWGTAANIDFILEGWCDTAPHRDEAVRIKVNSTISKSKAGREVRGTPNGMWLRFDQESMGDLCPNMTFISCVKVQAVHEFAHALGFGHESSRTDFTFSVETCPNLRPAPSVNEGEEAPVQEITYIDLPSASNLTNDPGSIADSGYCRLLSSHELSLYDVEGVRAVYGSGNTSCSGSRVCNPAIYAGQKGIRFRNGRYLRPSSNGGVSTQDFVGSVERVVLVKLEGDSDHVIHYGDSVAVRDRWGRYLRGRNDNEVDTHTVIGSWERWVVESPNPSEYNGQVLINGPVRLRSERWNKYLYLRNGSDVEIKSSTSGTELRIHGNFAWY